MSEEKVPRAAFAGLFVANGAAMLGLGIILPILSPYMERLGATGFVVGLVFAGYALARGILGPLVGRISDRIGRKRILAGGLLAYAALTPFYPAASSVVVVAGLWFLQGAASAMVTPIAQSYIGDITPEGREGEVMNLFYVSLFSGVAVGPFLGGWLADHVSRSAPFYAMGAAALLALVCVLVALPGGTPPGPEAEGGEGAEPGTREVLGSVLRDRPVRGILAYITTRGFYRWGFNSFFPLFAIRAAALSRSQVGLLLSGYMLTGSVLQYPLGRLADRWSGCRAGFVAVGGLLAAASMAAVPAAHRLWTLLVLVLAMGVFSAVSRASVVAVRTERGRRYGQGAVTGIYTAGLSAGQVAGPVGFGAVVPVLHIAGAFEVGAAAGILGTAAAWWLLRGTVGPRPGEPGPATDTRFWRKRAEPLYCEDQKHRARCSAARSRASPNATRAPAEPHRSFVQETSRMSHAYGPGRGRWATAGMKPGRASNLGLAIICMLVSVVALVGVLTLRARYGIAGPSSSPPLVIITATDYGFTLPDTLPAGPVRLRLVNRGGEPHDAVVTRLRPGAEAPGSAERPDDWMRGDVLPGWSDDPGVPGTVLPGHSAEAVVTLKAGRYVVACYVESPGGVMHVMKGMAREFEVVAPRPGEGPVRAAT